MPFLFPKRNIIFNQLIFSFLFIVVAILWKGIISASSVGVGCLVAVLPCAVFQKVFFTKTTQEAEKILKRFYLAAGLKFLTLIILFISAAQWQQLDIKTFFMAFIIMQVFYWGNQFLLLQAEGKVK